MGVRRGVFSVDDLVKAPEVLRPVVIISGGPVMDLEAIEGDKGLCKWHDWDAEAQTFKISRALISLVALYSCVPVNTEGL